MQIRGREKLWFIGVVLLLLVWGLWQQWTNSTDDSLVLEEKSILEESELSENANMQESSKSDAENAEKAAEGSQRAPRSIYVHVAGAVQHPGVYELTEEQRVIDAITLAGGAREDAALDVINLAQPLEDAMQIIVWTHAEVEEGKVQKVSPSSAPDVSHGENEGSAGKININTASKEELMQLPSIGAAKADRIIRYREEKPFQSIEELMEVSGIGQKTWERFKDQICVE